MFANDDVALFAFVLLSAVHRSTGPWHRAKDSQASFLGAFQQFQPSVSVGPDGPSFSFSAAVGAPDGAAVVRHAYGLLAASTRPVQGVVDQAVDGFLGAFTARPTSSRSGRQWQVVDPFLRRWPAAQSG